MVGLLFFSLLHRTVTDGVKTASLASKEGLWTFSLAWYKWGEDRFTGLLGIPAVVELFSPLSLCISVFNSSAFHYREHWSLDLHLSRSAQLIAYLRVRCWSTSLLFPCSPSLYSLLHLHEIPQAPWCAPDQWITSLPKLKPSWLLGSAWAGRGTGQVHNDVVALGACPTNLKATARKGRRRRGGPKD